MTLRWRLVLLAALTVVLLVTVGGYVTVRAVQAHRVASSAPPRGLASDPLAGQSRLLFRTTGLGTDNGLVEEVPLSDLSGRRTDLGVSCDRVHARGTEMVCLQTQRGVATTFGGRLFGADGRELESWPLAGIPSRARLSPSGRLESDTSFVSGHTYMQIGFSTAAVVRRVGGASYGNLERFAFSVDGRRVTAADRNIWGVTFADDDRHFYATAASGGHTWLVRGDLVDRTLTSVHENAECPSLSPDEAKVAYKKRVPEGGNHWALAVLDLRTGREAVLGERHSVDDQVEWLDDSTLLYALPRSGQVGVSDIWAVGVDSGERPRLVVRNASSPAVVR